MECLPPIEEYGRDELQGFPLGWSHKRIMWYILKKVIGQ